MTSINEIRKALKPLGFTVKTEKFSFGTSATYAHIETGKKLTFNIFTQDTRAFWLPVIEFCKAHDSELRTIQRESSISGLAMHTL